MHSAKRFLKCNKALVQSMFINAELDLHEASSISKYFALMLFWVTILSTQTMAGRSSGWDWASDKVTGAGYWYGGLLYLMFLSGMKLAAVVITFVYIIPNVQSCP